MDFFRNPRAAGFGQHSTHPLVTRTAPTPTPRPQPIPVQQVPTPRPFPAPQQQASQAGLHPSTLLYEKWILRPWEAESNEQDVKMTQQYQNYDTQQGRKVWLSGAFNDYLKQGIEPPPKVKEYFKSQGFDYDEAKTPTTEWTSLPDDAKAGLLTAYYEGKQLNPWQSKTVARMIQQETEDAKNLPAPGGDKTRPHLRWLQEFYKQNASKYKMPEKLQEQFVANKLVEEPAYTLNPAYTKYLEGMKASGLSLDDPSQWAARQEYYKANPRPAKYLQGKEKTPGWYSPEEAQKISALNATANQPAQAAAPAEAAAPAPRVGPLTQSPGYGAGTGTFTAQGPGGFTETIGQSAQPSPVVGKLEEKPLPEKKPPKPAATWLERAAGAIGLGQAGATMQPSPVVQKRGGRQKPIAPVGLSPEQLAAQAQVNAAQGGWKPTAAQPSPATQFPLLSGLRNAKGQKPVQFEFALTPEEKRRERLRLKEKRKTSRTLRFLGDNPSLPTFAERRAAAKQKAYTRRSGTYVGGKKRNLRGRPSVSSEMKRIVGESTWNKAMGGK